MSEPSYKALRESMREIDAAVREGEPRYALVIRGSGEAKWEQVAGQPCDMDRVRLAVARRLAR